MPEPRRSTRLQKRGQYDVRDWLDVGYAFFIQQKPQANVQNKWEDEVHLVYSQNGPKRYIIQVEEGETTELKLIYNVNFSVFHIQDAEDDELPDEEKAPKPGYHDLFYLTADHGALGKLEGPAVWTLGCFVDWEAHELLVSATGRRDGTRPQYALLRLPLRVERAAEFFRLSIDTKEMDKEAPGLHKEQTDLVKERKTKPGRRNTFDAASSPILGSQATLDARPDGPSFRAAYRTAKTQTTPPPETPRPSTPIQRPYSTAVTQTTPPPRSATPLPPTQSTYSTAATQTNPPPDPPKPSPSSTASSSIGVPSASVPPIAEQTAKPASAPPVLDTSGPMSISPQDSPLSLLASTALLPGTAQPKRHGLPSSRSWSDRKPGPMSPPQQPTHGHEFTRKRPHPREEDAPDRSPQGQHPPDLPQPEPKHRRRSHSNTEHPSRPQEPRHQLLHPPRRHHTHHNVQHVPEVARFTSGFQTAPRSARTPLPHHAPGKHVRANSDISHIFRVRPPMPHPMSNPLPTTTERPHGLPGPSQQFTSKALSESPTAEGYGANSPDDGGMGGLGWKGVGGRKNRPWEF